MIKPISNFQCISERKHLSQAQVSKILYVNFVLWWKASAKQMIPINQQQNNTNTLILGISNQIKGLLGRNDMQEQLHTSIDLLAEIHKYCKKPNCSKYNM